MQKKKITNFTDFFRNAESMLTVSSLALIPTEGFELREINDIETFRSYLPNLNKLDFSDNLVSKLNIKNFLNLTHITAARNMISEVNLVLTSLTHLDLSSNMISKMIDLSNLPVIQTINLNHNLIEKIQVQELFIAKKSLQSLQLAFNKIKFTSNDFVAFIEGLKILNLESFSLEGNKFITENKSLTHNYKLFIVATLTSLQIFNDQTIYITRDNLNAKEIMLQILSEEKEIKLGEMDNKNKAEDKKEKIEEIIKLTKNKTIESNLLSNANKSPKSPRKKFNLIKLPKSPSMLKKIQHEENYDLKLKLMKINLLFDELNISNGNDQYLYLQLMDEIDSCLAGQPKDEENIEIIQEEFSKFLMNCHFLIELNPKFEKGVYRSIAQFALYCKGVFFVESCFDFFESMVRGSIYRTKDIVEVLESVIIGQIEESKDNPPFKILDSIINFFSNTDIQCNKLYTDLIPSIIMHVKNFNLEKLKSENEQQDETSNFLTCLHFIQQYLKIDYHETIYDCEEFKEENHDMSNDDDENYQKYALQESDRSNFISDDENFEKNSKTSKDLYKEEYGFDLRVFEDRSDIFLEENIDEEENNLDGEEFKIKKETSSKYLEDFYEKESTNNQENGKNNLSNVAKKYLHKILNLKIYNLQDSNPEDRKMKLIYIYIITFRKCCEIAQSYFSLFNKGGGYPENVSIFESVLHLLITLSKRFSYYAEKLKLENYQKDLIKKEYSDSSIIQTLTLYLRKFIPLYIYDQNNFEKFLETKEVLNFEELEEESKDASQGQNVMENRSKNNLESYKLERLKSFKQMLVLILNCYGGLLRNTVESRLKIEVENEVSTAIFTCLISLKNDPLILTGACKFTYQIFSNEDVQSDGMLFSRIMNKLVNFTVLLRYINNSDSSYKGIFEKVSRLDNVSVDLNNPSLDPYSFDNLTSPYLIKLFLSILSLFKMVAFLSLIQGPVSSIAQVTNKFLTENKLHEYLGNCLKVKSDKLRKIAVKCIYYYDHTHIKTEVIDQIIHIISNYNSVTQGETEIILSTIYIILTNILASSSNVKLESTMKFSVERTIEMALDFIKKNLDRNPTLEEELVQKNLLGTSLIMFLNLASRNAEFNKILKPGIEVEFRTIYHSDFIYFNSDNYLPLELERTKFGNYLAILLETTRSDTPIPPFSYPFLRILLKIADLLSYSEEYTYSVDYSQDSDNLFKKLQKEIRSRICYRFINEKSSWYNFQGDLINWIRESKPVKQALKETMNSTSHMFVFRNKIRTMEEENLMKFHYDQIRDEYVNQVQENTRENEDHNKNNNFNNMLTQEDRGGNKNDLYTKIFKSRIDKEINSKLQNESDNPKIFKSVYNNKMSYEDMIREQVNFTAYFSNLLLFIYGLTSNMQESQIEKNIKMKVDQRIQKSEKIYSQIRNCKIKIKIVESESEEKIEEEKNSKNNKNNQNVENNNSQTNHSNSNYNTINEIMALCDSKTHYEKFNKGNTQSFYNHYSGDLEQFQLYGFDFTHKRQLEEETVHNPHIRSLIVSSLLRCIYSLLISPSKQITSNFMEILFLDDKWKNMIMLIDTASMFEYNIAHKAINTFQIIFNKFQLLPILRSFRNKSYYVNENGSPVGSYVNEERLFHTLYLFTLYFEKVLYSFNNINFKLDKIEILFLRDLCVTLHGFIYVLNEIKFSEIPESFIQKEIYKKLLKEEYIDILVFCSRSLKYHQQKTLNKIHQFSYAQLERKAEDSFSNNSQVFISKEYDEAEQNIINYLFTYYLQCEKCLDKIDEVLAIIMMVYPDCKNYILERIINLHIHQERAIANIKYQKLKYDKLVGLSVLKFGEGLDKKEGQLLTKGLFDNTPGNAMKNSSSEKDKKLNEKQENINRIRKTKIEKLISCQKVFINKLYIKENLQQVKFSFTDQILFFEICELFEFKSKSSKLAGFLMTNKEIYLFDIDTDNLNSIKQSYIKNINEPLYKMSIDKEIKKIYLFDYMNRFIFQYNEEYLSLLFQSYDEMKYIIEYLKYSYPSFNIFNLSTLPSMVNSLEIHDEFLKSKNNEKTKEDAKNNRDKKKDLLNIGNDYTDPKELKLLYEIFTRDFTINNNIYNNFYSNENLNVHDMHTFVVSNDYMTFMDYLTYLWRKEEIFIKERKVVYLSKFYVYLLRENLDNLGQKILSNLFNSTGMNIDGKEFGLYDVLMKISIDDIVSMERHEHLGLTINFKDEDQKFKEVSFYFSGPFELNLFGYKLDLKIREIIYSDVLNRNKNNFSYK
jgi:hypothetical protein